MTAPLRQAASPPTSSCQFHLLALVTGTPVKLPPPLFFEA